MPVPFLYDGKKVESFAARVRLEITEDKALKFCI